MDERDLAHDIAFGDTFNLPLANLINKLSQQLSSANSRQTLEPADNTAKVQPLPELSQLALASERLQTNPDLFARGKATRMASALPIWEASNILTQRDRFLEDRED